MKPPESRKAELAPNATGGKKSRAEAAESAEFKMTELGPIPVDWEVKRLGEIFAFKNGYNASANCYGSGMPVASVLDALSNRPLLRQSIDTKVNAPYKDQDSFSLKFGDLIFTRSSETLEDVGRSNVYLDEGNAMFGGFVIRGRPSVLIDSLFVNYMLNTSPCRIRVMSHGAGAQHFNIGQSGLEKVLIPLPPLAEQRRIAGALSDVDELISALGKLIEKKRNIKTGAMQELLTGKTRLPGFKGKWVEKTFCEFISRFATGLNPRQNFKLNSGGNNYYITIKDFKNGKISFNGCDKVDDLALRLINERSDLRAGDLLFSSIGRVGDAYVIKDTPSNWNINESVFSLRPDESQMDVNFLYYLVKSSAVQERLTSGITGSTLTGIKIGELRGIVCFYPNELAEQKAIAAVLSDIDAEIAALEADRAKYKSIKQGMMQELLTGRTRLM